MNDLSPIIWAFLGIVLGALASWLFARVRQWVALSAAEASAVQASTALQIELSSARRSTSAARPRSRPRN
jgi:hypothetical protein